MKQIIKIFNELENEVNEMEQTLINQDEKIEIDELIIVDNKLYLNKDIKNYDLSEVNEYLIISDEDMKYYKDIIENLFNEKWV
ncbi:MAG: hypothetical protein QM490_01930 [Candidatus Gracilibacteria bacterium]